MNKTRSFLTTGVLAIILGAGQLILPLYGREFRFFNFFGPAKQISAVLFIVAGILLILYPFFQKQIRNMFSKKNGSHEKDSND